jgi:hypothetical protein
MLYVELNIKYSSLVSEMWIRWQEFLSYKPLRAIDIFNIIVYYINVVKWDSF